MTEGNIAKWNVKEGDSFMAGDVLLEIETDKASMDVEAQDNGVVAKILQGDGCKGIKVGTNIGILAEPGDDLKLLDMSFKETAIDSCPGKNEPDSKSEVTTANVVSSPQLSSAPPPRNISGPTLTRNYQLLPSVQCLIHLHNLSHSDIENITPSGPNNRLLKGDVLAYLGHVSTSYPSQLSSKISNLSRLNLSDIKLKKMAPTSKSSTVPSVEVDQSDPMISLQQSVSLKSVHEIQEKLKAALGISLADDVFITRATKISNENLPRHWSHKTSPDDLFDSILGQKTKSIPEARKSHYYFPSKIYGSSRSQLAIPKPKTLKKLDIIDILSGKKASSAFSLKTSQTRSVTNDSVILKLDVPKEDEKRALLFLGGVKTTLERKPETLVL